MQETTTDSVLRIIIENPGNTIKIAHKLIFANGKKISYHGIYKEAKKLERQGKIIIKNNKIFVSSDYLKYLRNISGFGTSHNTDIQELIHKKKSQVDNLLGADKILSLIIDNHKYSSLMSYTHNIWWPFLHLSEPFTERINKENISYTIFSSGNTKLDNWAAGYEELANHQTFFIKEKFPWDMFIFEDLVILLEFNFDELSLIFENAKKIKDLKRAGFKEFIHKIKPTSIEFVTESKKINFYKELLLKLKKPA